MARLPERFSRAWGVLPGAMLLAIPVLAWAVVQEYRGTQTAVVPQEPAMTIAAGPTESTQNTRIGSDWTGWLTARASETDALQWLEERGTPALPQLRNVPVIGGTVRFAEDTLRALKTLRNLTPTRKRRW